MKKRWIAIFGLCLMTFTGTACARPAQKESAEPVQNPLVREPCRPQKTEGPVGLVWDWQAPGEKTSTLAKETAGNQCAVSQLVCDPGYGREY